MSNKFHPKHETLLHYAAGNLSPAYMSVVNIHTKFCSGCSNLVSQFEQLGGEALEQTTQTVSNTMNTNDANFIQLMDRIDHLSLEEEDSFNLEPKSEQQINKIMQYAKLYSKHNALRKGKWIQVARGINDQKVEIQDPQYTSRLIHIKAGTKIPSHTHHGEEITVVLKGSFSDEYGTYKAGDFLVRDGAYEHSPYADSDCICYAITDAPLHYTGLFGPVINWFNHRFERKHYGNAH